MKHFPQNLMTIGFSQLKGQGPTKSLYAIHHHFKKCFWQKNKKDIALPKIFILFLVSCLSNGTFTKALTSSSKNLTIVAWS